MDNNATTWRSTRVCENEAVKAQDMQFYFDSMLTNIALAFESIFSGSNEDYVIGGRVVPYGNDTSGTNYNVCIEPIFAYCAYTGQAVVKLNNDKDPAVIVSIGGDRPLGDSKAGRYIIEVRPSDDRVDDIGAIGHTESEYAPDFRMFQDPTTGFKRPIRYGTRKEVLLIARARSDSSGDYPLHEKGWIKLAEVDLPEGVTSITPDMIHNITARYPYTSAWHTDGHGDHYDYEDTNRDWAREPNATFNTGYFTELVKYYLSEHDILGRHKAEVIHHYNIDLNVARSDRALSTTLLPLGHHDTRDLVIHNEHFSYTRLLWDTLATIVDRINDLYPYADDILSRYTLAPATTIVGVTGAISPPKVPIDTTGATPLPVDIGGVSCNIGQRVLLLGQTNIADCGVYTITSPGSSWTRVGDIYDSLGKLYFNDIGDGRVYYLDCDRPTLAQHIEEGTTTVFREAIYSPYDIPGRAILRDQDGRARVAQPRHLKDISRLQEIQEAKRYMERMVMPPGYIYAQLPGMPPPENLPDGTKGIYNWAYWEDCTSEYIGLYPWYARVNDNSATGDKVTLWRRVAREGSEYREDGLFKIVGQYDSVEAMRGDIDNIPLWASVVARDSSGGLYLYFKSEYKGADGNPLYDMVQYGSLDGLGAVKGDTGRQGPPGYISGVDISVDGSYKPIPEASARLSGEAGDQRLSLSINGLRGAKGEKGDKGDAGHIEAIDIATIEDGGATRGSATMEGDSAHITLYNIKGTKGDKGDVGPAGQVGAITSVGVTVDDTIGSPRGTATIEGLAGDQRLTIALSGIKGQKGDKGDIGATGDIGAKGDKGIQGDKGDRGEPFSISCIYPSYDDMVADASNISQAMLYTLELEAGTHTLTIEAKGEGADSPNISGIPEWLSGSNGSWQGTTSEDTTATVTIDGEATVILDSTVIKGALAGVAIGGYALVAPDSGDDSAGRLYIKEESLERISPPDMSISLDITLPEDSDTWVYSGDYTATTTPVTPSPVEEPSSETEAWQSTGDSIDEETTTTPEIATGASGTTSQDSLAMTRTSGRYISPSAAGDYRGKWTATITIAGVATIDTTVPSGATTPIVTLDGVAIEGGSPYTIPLTIGEHTIAIDYSIAAPIPPEGTTIIAGLWYAPRYSYRELVQFCADDSKLVHTTGGTITGTLTLEAPPTDTTDAVTKGYVDTAIGDIPPGTSVKGDRETTYRTGEVNITPANIGAVPDSRTINGKPLSGDITLTPANIGAVPDSRTINGKALSSNVTLSYSDISGAVPLPTGTVKGSVSGTTLNLTITA